MRHEFFTIVFLVGGAGLTITNAIASDRQVDVAVLTGKKADVWPCYLNSQGVIIKQKLAKAGEPVGFLNPADYGVKFVANSVVTSRRMLERQPETARRFAAALMAAWEAAVNPANESKAMQALLKYDKTTAADLQKDQLAATRPLIKPTPDTKIGTIDVAAWKQTEAIMLKQKQIAKSVQVERVLKPIQ